MMTNMINDDDGDPWWWLTLKDEVNITEAIETQGEKPWKSEHPPTAQTPGPNCLIFWRESPHVINFGRTEAIF